MKTTRMFALVPLLLLAGCGSDDDDTQLDDHAPCSTPRTSGAPFGTQCSELVDSKGRVAYLRGVNARVEGIFDVTFDDGRVALEAIPAFDASDADQMRDFGFDALRLPINWSALEPTQDGGFDESYLDRIATALDQAAGAGLVVLLDMHQDAYSKEIGEDGAPLWAIIPPPTQLLEGPLEDLGDRRNSKQVLDAFATFFGASADGEFLRERFVDAVEHVMQRFATHPAVVGMEIFNEPQDTDDGIARLNDVAYPRLRAAVPDKLYVFEPPVIRNVLDEASVPSEPLGKMVGYAPHVYTLAFVGTDEQHQSMTKETLLRSHDNARVESDAWQAPLIVTEWGYDPNGIKASEYMTWQSELAEEHRESTFFWVWKEQSQGNWGCFDFDAATSTFSARPEIQKALARVRPSRVAGWPTSVSFDRATGEFELQFLGNPRVSADHEIAIAKLLGQPLSVECDGKSVDFVAIDEHVISIRCGRGSTAEHVLRVSVNPLP